MKHVLNFVLAFVIALPASSVFNVSPAYSQSIANQLQRNRIYQDTLRQRQIERQRTETLRRQQDAQRRQDAQRQRQIRADQARRARENSLILQRQLRERLRTREQEFIRRGQTDRARQLRLRREQDRNRLTLTMLALSRMQIQARLSQLPRPATNLRAPANRIVARAVKPRPIRPTMRNTRCSFHGDTLVLTETGMVPIRDIEVGVHRVWAMDEYTGETGWKDVLAQYSSDYDETVYVSVLDPDTGQTQTIISNRIHPFFGQPLEDRSSLQFVSHSSEPVFAFEGDWIEAADLELGTLLLSSDGTWDEVIGVFLETEVLVAYNLTVDRFRTYFVSSTHNLGAIWVHNDCFSDRQLLSSLGLRRNEMNRFHRDIKPEIVRQFRQELSATRVRNPDIGQDDNGNVIFRDPDSKRVILRTDIPLSSYGEIE